MFSSISVRNFQAFEAETIIPLAPITLIFGPNASGKSSFSRALRLLKQSIDSSNGANNGLDYSGPEVNLNGYRSVVFGQIGDSRESDDSDLTIGLRFEAAELGKTFAGLSHVTWDLTVGTDVHQGDVRRFTMNCTRFWFTEEFALDNAPGLEFCIQSFGSQVAPEVTCGSILFDESGNVATTAYRIPPDEMETLVSIDHDVVKAIINSQLRRVPVDGPMEYWFGIQNSIAWYDVEEELGDDDPGIVEPEGWDGIFLEFGQLKNNFIGMKSLRAVENRETLVRGKFLADLFQQVRLAISANLMNMNYVGPIRSIPELVQVGGTSGARINPMSNLWLKQLTNSRYEISSEQVGIQEHAHDIWVNLVKDNFTGVWNSFQDVGTGISQVFPVIDACLPAHSARWGTSRSEVIVIEQPELHLHPAAQSKLGDMFTFCVNTEDRNVQFIIETHSENLLLRIQKKIRDGLLAPEKVRVIFVEPILDPGSGKFVRTIASEVRLDNAGDVIDPFPISFAELRIQDLL